MSRSFKSSSSYLSEQELGWVMRIVTALAGLSGVNHHRRRKLHLSDVVQVQRDGFADLVEQRIHGIRDLRGIRFQRDAVAFVHRDESRSFFTTTFSMPLPTA